MFKEKMARPLLYTMPGIVNYQFRGIKMKFERHTADRTETGLTAQM
jgi:hypothetical protein